MSTTLSHIKITITGHLGSGKSVVGRKLAEQYNIKYFSTGDIQRRLAAEKHLNTLEMNQFAEKSRDIDDTIDNFSRSLNEEDSSFVIDSRLAWHFIPSAFKVFLQVDHEEAARRIMGDHGRSSESYMNLNEAIKAINLRQQSEQDRYRKLYRVELYDMNNYHLVINTTKRDVDSSANIIMEELERFRHNEQNIFPQIYS